MALCLPVAIVDRIGVWLAWIVPAKWLAALFLGEILTATAMGSFAGEIDRVVVLALFVPLIVRTWRCVPTH